MLRSLLLTPILTLPTNEYARIIGGDKQTDILGWMVSVQNLGQHKCGGILYNNTFIITAAHCHLKDAEDKLWNAQFNMLSFNDAASFNIKLINRQVHPNFDEQTLLNDIAVWELEYPVELLEEQPRLAYNSCFNKVGGMGQVYGWGKTNENSTMAPSLMKATLPLVPFHNCTKTLNTLTEKKSQLCAGTLDGSKDACFGDSGGPLIKWTTANSKSDEVPYLVGIISYGEGCGRKNKLGIYTKITHYRKWIQEVTGTDDALLSDEVSCDKAE